MDIKHIKRFVEIVDKGSVSAASKDERVTLQAMSRSVRELEAELKGSLILRTPTGVRTTPLGEEFYKIACKVIQEHEKLEQLSTEYWTKENGGSGKTLVTALLCSSPLRNEKWLCEKTAELIRKKLRTGAVVCACPEEEAIALLAGGQADVLITIGPIRYAGIDCLTVGNLYPAALVDKGHPLARKGQIGIRDLDGCRIDFLDGLDAYSETLSPLYEQLRRTAHLVTFDPCDIGRFLKEEGGVVLVPGVPEMTGRYPDTVLVPITQDSDALITVCLNSMKSRKSDVYWEIEHLFASEIAEIGSGTFARKHLGWKS